MLFLDISCLWPSWISLSYVGTWTSLSSISQATWEAFNTTLSGRLHEGAPMMSSCYPSMNNPTEQQDPTQCAAEQSLLLNANLASNEFSWYSNFVWSACQTTGASCPIPASLATNSTCQQGSISPRYVAVQSVEDVQATLNFTRTHGLRLVIKNTGHDYRGRSSAPDSLALWMHPYQPPIQLLKDFTPEGCPAPTGDVIKFGAGQQFKGIYDFVQARGYRVVGGGCDSVGAAGGWITGGGHGLLANELGLGVDNVQEIKVVLPNGTYATATRCQNPDLFFALRGGGGGTFGVVMEMNTLVHPDRPMMVLNVSLTGLEPSSSAKDITALFIEHAERWAAEGWGGFLIPGVTEYTIVMATALLNYSDAMASVQPVLDLAREMKAKAPATTATLNRVDGFLEFLGPVSSSPLLLTSEVSTAVSSRIIPRTAFQNATSRAQLTDLIYELLISNDTLPTPPSLRVEILLVAPALYSQTLAAEDQASGPGASSVTPAWRTGLWHVMHTRLLDSRITDPEIIRQVWQSVSRAMDPLREFTPGSGAYQNEGDPFEPDPIGAFWGEENYDRLLRIKEEVDPENLLTVHQGVGWDRTDARFKCFPDV
ncbi:FAD-binding domain-containing protein [Aspergillus homomorphus CBS 101889]|uniref:FAD-binding domain-containing protein n=1 Tax=Aspergillus homomorphus (strain CBS 101889) TaxID=1450537 RepID=A0A395I5L3_ASPHC|nr:FAD-binding domain-containing protein [Aspergillus homomorphus CBS 101889]RAL15380.1 FAD-binding domain-containing protein [Aspergillus homomorphus CBS 101889]